MSKQVVATAPKIGMIVHYQLSKEDAEQINRRRTTGKSIAARLPLEQWPTGAQAHIGNSVDEGQVYPMMITRCWGTDPHSSVNGQVFLDGNDVFWATSVSAGTGPKTFSW
jgi:hypothetical protein